MAKKISDLVASIFHKKHDWKIDLFRSWPEIVGPLSAKVRLEKITEDTIVLGVHNSCLLQELYLLSPVLLKSINKTLDQPRIKTVRFIVADMATKKGTKKLETKIRPLLCKKKPLSKTEQDALKKIADKDLQTALAGFLVRCYQERGL